MAHLHHHTLFLSPLTSISDVSCREPASPCGAEEHATGHQLVVVRRGVWMKHSGVASRRQLVAEPVHALFLNRHEPYRVSHPVAGGDECTVLDFSSESAWQVARACHARPDDDRAGPFDISHAPMTSATLLELRSLRRMLRSRTAGTLAVEEEAIAILARTPGASWSLAQLASDVCSSPFHLTRVFRESIGLPVHQYLLRLRLTLALERIEQGENRLSTLALDLGFSSHSHLSSAFRRVFGMSPTAVGCGDISSHTN